MHAVSPGLRAHHSLARWTFALFALASAAPAQPGGDPTADLIAVEAQRDQARTQLRHGELIAQLNAIAARSAGTETERTARARATELQLEWELLQRLGDADGLRAQPLAATLARVAALQLGAQDHITLHGLYALIGDTARAEACLATARDRDAGLKDSTDRALAAMRRESVPQGGYHRYRNAWLPLQRRDLARALDDALAALQVCAPHTPTSLPFSVAADAPNLVAVERGGEPAQAALRTAAAQLRGALDKRYAGVRDWFASYGRAARRAELLEADKRSRERAQAARDKIAVYDKPQQHEVDALRDENAELTAQLDALRNKDRTGYLAASPADAQRLRQTIVELEDALRQLDAYFAQAGLPRLPAPEYGGPADAGTGKKRLLPGRSHSGLEDVLWLMVHARAGAVLETIARADDLLHRAAELTPWERLVVEDLRDEAIAEFNDRIVASSLDEAERQFLDTLNRYRRTLRLRSVEIDDRLVRSSRKHCEEMVKLGYFGHISPVAGRRTPTDRAQLEGFAGGVGENCLAGSVDGNGAFNGWYHSPGHHRGMVSSGPLLGVGATADHGMWTMVIGGGDGSWRTAHRDALPQRRAEASALAATLAGEARQAKKTKTTRPTDLDDQLLPALLRLALPLCQTTRPAERAVAAELLRLAVSLSAVPEQRVLLDTAARTAKERLDLDLPLPPLPETTKTPPQPKLAVPHRSDGPSLKAPLKLLSKAERARLAKQFGGGPRTERAVERGLAFLAKCQDVDGAWRARSFAELIPGLTDRHDVGRGNAEWECAMTGLALLCYTATGSSLDQGEYAAQVRKGTRFLMSKLLDYGRFETAASHYMYNHAIATQALCEVYAYSADPTLGVYAQLAVDYLIKAQHRPSGGWRYEPNEQGDTSVVGWVVMALNSAYKAQLDAGGYRDALRFLDSVTEKQYYRVGYLTPNDGAIFGNRLAAVAATSRRFLGQDIGDARMYWASVRMAEDLPSPQKPDYYYWYYGTLTMFQMGGDFWKAWSDPLVASVLDLHVDKEGQPTDGSWQNDHHYSGTGGRIYNTAMAILCLTAFYRYDRAPKTKLAPFSGDLDKALQPYLAVLLDPKDDGIARLTEAKLADSFGAYAVPGLLRALEQPLKEPVRRHLAALIEQLADERSELALLQKLTVSDDGEVRKALVRALERCCTHKSIPALIAALQRDQHPHVRGQAARALGALGAKDAVDELTQRLGAEPDGWAKEQIQNALRRIASQDALDGLVNAAIGDASGRAGVRAGLALLERDQLPDRIAALASAQPKLHKRLLETVGKERDQALLPVLITLLEADDESLRATAIGFLEALTRERHGFDAKQDAGVRAEPVRRWRAWWDGSQHRYGGKAKKK